MNEDKKDVIILVPINRRLRDRFATVVGKRQMARTIRSLIEYYLEVMEDREEALSLETYEPPQNIKEEQDE